MGVLKFVGNKLLSILLGIIALVIITPGSSISGLIALVFIIAAVYFWVHAPFH